jgi:putative ABC transport system ATP-binding protein
MTIENSEPLIELKGINKSFGTGKSRVDALKSINVKIYPGQVIGLLGPSGSGKTTLLNVIGCIEKPSHGWMKVDNEVIFDEKWLRKDLRKLRLEKVGFIFQFHNLLPFLTNSENIEVVLNLAGYSQQASRTRATELLEYLDIVQYQDAYPAKLSGGEAQRVAIARALANKPRIILADEPTAALDSVRAGIVMDLLRKLAQEQKAAVIVVTHDEKIYDRFDHIFHLRDGVLELKSD